MGRGGTRLRAHLAHRGLTAGLDGDRGISDVLEEAGAADAALETLNTFPEFVAMVEEIENRNDPR